MADLKEQLERIKEGCVELIPEAELLQKLKKVLDPNNVMSPGRLCF